MDIKDAVGKWCLIRQSADWFGKPQEAKIIDLSPSEKYVRYKLSYEAHPVWRNVSDIKLLEILCDA